MEWVGWRSLGSLECLEKSWGSSQQLFVYGSCYRGARAKRRSRSQLSPEAAGGRQPHACSGLPPSETWSLCGASFLPELKKMGRYIVQLPPLHPPTRFHYGQMKNDSFKTILTLTIIKVYRRSHKAIKVSLLQSLFGYSIVRHCIIKN